MTAPETHASSELEARVLILAPFGRDAQLAEHALRRAGLATHTCADLAEVRSEIAAGAGAVLLTDEALSRERAALPDAWFGSEPAWSELPLVVLTAAGAVAPRIAALRRLERRRNATFIQRPVARLTLVSALRAAVESRRRQYAVRDLLDELEAGVRQRDDFLAMLGHELRNPLAAITNAGELLHAETPWVEDTARFAGDVIQRQSRHLTRILDDLLEISRITRGKLELRREPLELGRVVRGVVEAARPQLRERRHQLELVLPEEPVRVHADPTRVEQILWNLFDNASKYTDPCGHIRVELAVGDACAELKVADDGKGMTPAFLGRAFDLFAQAEFGGGGLGLGLPLSRRLAELHQGSLAASSAGLGKGSEFVLRLPLNSGGAEGRPVEASQRAEPRRVLLVEDHADLAWSLEIVLRRMGHDVCRAATGAEALAAAPAYEPDVALVDIGLPDMDGTEVTKRLRESLGTVLVIAAMSGFGQEAVRRRSLEAGCDHYLTKPVQRAELRRLLGG